MISNEDCEEEIKIEYFESYDEDPLCEKLQTHATEDVSVLLDFPSENINNKTLEPEGTWYKYVDHSGRYHCKFCEHSYSTIQTVRHHVKKKHFEEYDPIRNTTIKNIRRRKSKCHICKKRYKNINDLKEHVSAHDLKNIQKSCSVCHAMFENDTEMIIHRSIHKLDKKKLHFCSICGYSTSKLSHFKQHEKTHTLKYLTKCSYCEYSTNRPANLTIHERLHTNYKPYKCMFKDCEYSCATKSALHSHRLKHEKEKNMVYCDKCSYSTVYKQSLKKHIDSHTRNTVRVRF